MDEGRIDRRSVALGGLVALGAGAAAGLSGVGTPARGLLWTAARWPRPEGPAAPRAVGARGTRRARVALWAADRAGHALYGVGEDGAVEVRVDVDAPLEVRGREGGGCLVRSAVERRRGGEERWLQWDGRSLSPARPPGERLRALPPAAAAGRGAIVATAPRGIDGAWIVRRLPEHAGDRGEAAAEGGGGAAGGDGLPRGSVLEGWSPDGRGGWDRPVSHALPFDPRAVASSSGGAWVAGARIPAARWVSWWGRAEVRVTFDDLDGVDDLLGVPSERGGGVWLAAGGALARLDASGRRRPGQGGFAHLVSLALERSPPS